MAGYCGGPGSIWLGEIRPHFARTKSIAETEVSTARMMSACGPAFLRANVRAEDAGPRATCGPISTRPQAPCGRIWRQFTPPARAGGRAASILELPMNN